LHTLSHGVAKALVFCAAGDAVQRCGSRDVQAIRGLLAAAPWAGTLLLLGILALAGMPPSAIFISELLVIRSGILDHPGVVAGVLAAMVAIFAGLIHQVGRMVYGEPGAVRRGETRLSLIAMMLLAAAVIGLGVWIPAALDDVLARATEVVVG